MKAHVTGFGVESRGTTLKVPNPFAIKQEKWLFNIMVIDTHGAQDKKVYTNCRCDHMNLSKDFYNCKQIEGFQGSRRMISLRYKISWVDWNKHQVPDKVYILHFTDKIRSNGFKIIHDFQAEYIIPTNGGGDYPRVQKANIPIEK
ncbi:hypothetical protein GmHk_01G001703 [Glycine max]|nr:hypothetical protein GmHk_01G001703 [Glycine max]